MEGDEMTNVIPFRKPANSNTPPGEPLLFVTIYPNATHFEDPTRDEPDHAAAADAIFDSTFHVWKQHDECVLLIALGANRSTSMRSPHAFDTEAQRQWLRRRLDGIYEHVTGQPRIRSRLATFIRRIFHGDDQ